MKQLSNMLLLLKTKKQYIAALFILIIFFILIISFTSTKKVLHVDITPIETTSIAELRLNLAAPNPLIVQFYHNDPDQPVSVAPLNKIKTTVTQYVHLSPAISGQWRWASGQRLVFTPTKPWPASTQYSLTIDNSLFANHWKLIQHDWQFSTPAFSAEIQNAHFYLNPKNPHIKNIVATIAFNYPVDRDSISGNIQLLNKHKENIPYTHHLGPYQRHLYIQSRVIDLQQQAQFVSLRIKKGIKTTRGGSKLAHKNSATIKVPSIYGLQITTPSTNITINKQGDIQHVLSIPSNFGVANQTLKNHLTLYLLDQADSKTLLDNNWLDNPLMVNKPMLERANQLKYQMITAAHAYPTNHEIIFNAPSGRVLFIQIKKDLTSLGGFELQNNYQALAQVQALPKLIQFNHKGSLLALTGNESIDLWQRGLNAIQIKISKIKSDQLYNFISQTYGDFTDPDFINSYTFNKNNMSTTTSFIKSFPDNLIQQPQPFSIDFHKLKNQFSKPGLFLVKITGWNLKTKQPLDISTSRLVLLTNFGLIVKSNADGSHDVFVQSIPTDKPVGQAHVALLGLNGLPIQSAVSDSQGHAYLPPPNSQQDTGPRSPLVYLIKKGNDVSLIPYQNQYNNRSINLSRFDTGGRYVDTSHNNSPKALTAFIFTDRGLYRPGATIHLAGIIKQQDWGYKNINVTLAGLPLTLIITSPSGKTIDKQELRLTESGLLTSTWHSPINANSGTYNISYYLGDDTGEEQLLGSAAFRIATFTPETMKMQVKFNRAHNALWTSTKNLNEKN